MVPEAEFTLLLRPADHQDADVEGARRRRSTCSSAGSPAAPRCSRPAPTLTGPAARCAGSRRLRRRWGARQRRRRSGPRPRPAGAVPAHAAGGQADVADVGGLVDPVAVRRRLAPARPRLPSCTGVLRRPARAARPAAARPRCSGPRCATYTAVLLADTAVPAWHEAHPRAAVRVRRQRPGRRRRARRWSLAPVAEARPGAAAGGARRARSSWPPSQRIEHAARPGRRAVP